MSPAPAVRNAPGGRRRPAHDAQLEGVQIAANLHLRTGHLAPGAGERLADMPGAVHPGRPTPHLEHRRDQIIEPDLGRLSEPRHQRGVIAGHEHERVQPPRPLSGDHGHLAPERVGRIHQAAQQAQRQLTRGAGRTQRRGHLIERCLRVCEVPDLHRPSIARPGGSPMHLGG